jgi:uncharacterized protein (DUF305 family)
MLLVGALAAGGTALLTACGSMGMDHSGMDHSSATPMGGMDHSSATPSGDYDRSFIDLMVPHHQAAVEMAKVAQAHATHAELKTLADAIINAQDNEIAQMRGWRKAWYGSDQTPAGMGEHQMAGMDVDLNQLAAANPFDRAFIDAMIPHHQSAIEMAQEAQTRAQHQEIRDLAGRIIADQQREIDQMRVWRAQWYPG